MSKKHIRKNTGFIFYAAILFAWGVFFAGNAKAAIPALPGDISSDKQVDLDDFAIMAEQWLTAGPGLPADLTGNEVVDQNDLVQLSLTWLDFMVQDAFTSYLSGNNWVIVDEGTINPPSSWSISGGCLQQTSNIYGPDAEALSGRKGTYAYWQDPAARFWADYQFGAMLYSGDNDGMGVMFRYQDAYNYYKFDIDVQKNFRKLFKMVNGVESTIGYAEVAGYTQNEWATILVDVQGNQINIFFNGTNVFGGPIVDNDITRGAVALYCWGNNPTKFDDAWVHIFSTANSVAAQDDSYEASMNTPLTVSPAGVLDNDTAATEPLTATLVTPPAHGQVQLNFDGTFTYTPVTDYYGPDSFVYEAAAGGATDQATVHLWVLSGQEFSIVLLPDTQKYSESYPAVFNSQTQWIVDNKTTRNIAFVLQEGDITDNNITAHWINAENAISTLDGEVPYVLTVGNHDNGTNGSADVRDTTNFNTYFPVSRFNSLPQFGGVYQAGHMENSYHYFTAGGIDWLVFALEFGPRTAVLNWANTIVSAHPNHRVIVVTHNYMYSDDTRSGTGDASNPHIYTLCTTAAGDQVCNDGEEMWTNFIKLHPNMTFVFSGHILNDGTGKLVSTGDYGNPVYQMLANYQFLTPNGGNGYLRIVKIYPAQENSKVTVQTYSPYLNMYNRAEDHQFEFTNVDLTTP